jgi:hypothetical protein
LLHHEPMFAHIAVLSSMRMVGLPHHPIALFLATLTALPKEIGRTG